MKKFEFQVLDPTGVVVTNHDFEYDAGYGNRIAININGNIHAFSFDGSRYLNSDNEGICKCCGKKMQVRTEPEYICMNPYCENYIKLIKNEI